MTEIIGHDQGLKSGRLAETEGGTVAPVLRIRAGLTGWQGGPGINTFHFTAGTAPGSGFSNDDANDCADLVHSFYNTVRAYLVQQVRVDIVPEAVVYDDATGLVAAVESLSVRPTVVGGSAEMDSVRAQMIVSKLRTGVTVGRRLLMGRHFIGPASQIGIDDNGQVEATAIAAITTAYGGMIDNIGPKICVWHRPVNEAGGVTAAVQTATVKPAPGILRSRRD